MRPHERAGGAVVHPQQRARRGAPRASTWWGKAWVRGIEESAYNETDLGRARALSRAGVVGGITVRRGLFVASVSDGDGLYTASVALPVLDETTTSALVEVIAAQTARIGSLLAGELPHSLVEHAEEAGVELLPFGSELDASCTCDAWLDPCVHALAVMYQVTWLIEVDPFVLLQLRGLPRDQLLAALHELTGAGRDGAGGDGAGGDGAGGNGDDPGRDGDPVLDTAVDAALRAARILELVDDLERPIDHLF
jgi:uncharacterized Zn finger protein